MGGGGAGPRRGDRRRRIPELARVAAVPAATPGTSRRNGSRRRTGLPRQARRQHTSTPAVALPDRRPVPRSPRRGHAGLHRGCGPARLVRGRGDGALDPRHLRHPRRPHPDRDQGRKYLAEHRIHHPADRTRRPRQDRLGPHARRPSPPLPSPATPRPRRSPHPRRRLPLRREMVAQTPHRRPRTRRHRPPPWRSYGEGSWRRMSRRWWRTSWTVCTATQRSERSVPGSG